MVQAGAAEVNLILLANESGMDDKLATLITYVQNHQHVDSVELQASEIFRLVIFSLTIARRRGLRSVSPTECRIRSVHSPSCCSCVVFRFSD